MDSAPEQPIGFASPGLPSLAYEPSTPTRTEHPEHAPAHYKMPPAKGQRPLDQIAAYEEPARDPEQPFTTLQPDESSTTSWTPDQPLGGIRTLEVTVDADELTSLPAPTGMAIQPTQAPTGVVAQTTPAPTQTTPVPAEASIQQTQVPPQSISEPARPSTSQAGTTTEAILTPTQATATPTATQTVPAPSVPASGQADSNPQAVPPRRQADLPEPQGFPAPQRAVPITDPQRPASDIPASPEDRSFSAAVNRMGLGVTLCVLLALLQPTAAWLLVGFAVLIAFARNLTCRWFLIFIWAGCALLNLSWMGGIIYFYQAHFLTRLLCVAGWILSALFIYDDLRHHDDPHEDS